MNLFLLSLALYLCLNNQLEVISGSRWGINIYIFEPAWHCFRRSQCFQLKKCCCYIKTCEKIFCLVRLLFLRVCCIISVEEKSSVLSRSHLFVNMLVCILLLQGKYLLKVSFLFYFPFSEYIQRCLYHQDS